MDNGLLNTIILAIVLFVGILVWKKVKVSRVTAPASLKSSSPAEIADLAPPVPSPRFIDENDEQTEAERTADQARADRRSIHDATDRDAKKKIEDACIFVREANLDSLIPRLFGLTRHWSSWVKKPDHWAAPQGVSSIEGERERRRNF